MSDELDAGLMARRARQVRTWLAAVLTAGVAVGLVGCDLTVDKRRAVDSKGCVWEIWVNHNNNGVEKNGARAWLEMDATGKPMCGAP